MKARGLIALVLTGLVAASMIAPSAVAAKAPKPKVVGTDKAGDWGANSDPGLAPLGDPLGQDLTGASIVSDGKTVTFTLQLNALPPTGGVPELSRYIWSLNVNGNYVELDGKFTNYSRGACDPTSGQCPPPRDPGMQPFMVRGNCSQLEGQAVTVCEELGFVKATFDAAAATISIPVPASLIGAKPGSKITPGTSEFTSLVGGNVVAIPSAFLSLAPQFPADSMVVTGTYVVPKK